jgi:quercetin dioxygenase-like cupin family protein
MRRFLVGFGWAACGASIALDLLIACGASPARTASAAPTASAYVLGRDEGEVLHRANGKIVVKVDPSRGSQGLSLGTQDLFAGSGIPIHRHDGADEVLMIEEGRAHAIVDGKTIAVGPGSIVYVPRGTWHGVESAGDPIHLVWIVTPPGLEAFFRAVGAAPGEPVKQLSPADLEEIGRQHGTTFRR